jgi:hypothetical protein
MKQAKVQKDLSQKLVDISGTKTEYLKEN